MTPSSERLEQESEQTGLRLADALDELSTRLSPGHVVDQPVDYATDGGAAEFMRNLGDDVGRNPLPVTLTAKALSKCPSSREPGIHPFPDDRALELGEHAHHLE
jgi:hypothetical protein